MKYRLLGKTGLKVSAIGFGCWAIGGSGYGPTRDEDSLAALETALEHGVNFFDTADTYGHGHSEELLGKFLAGKNRAPVYVASKAGWDFYHPPSRKNFDPAHLRFACEQSLKRLGREAIDLYQLHNPNEEQIRSGEAVGELEKLKAEGKIRFIGISIHREPEALAAMEDGRIDCLQVIMNLLDQRMAARVFAEARQKNVGILAREPLASGLLTGKYGRGHEFAKEDHRRRWTAEKLDADFRKIEMIREVLATNRLSLAQAALEFILDFEAVSCVIPGAKTPVQVLENLAAVEKPLLRIQEAAQLRHLFEHEEIFKQGLIPG